MLATKQLIREQLGEVIKIFKQQTLRKDKLSAIFMSKRLHLLIEKAINKIMVENKVTASQGHILMYIIEHQEGEVYSTEIHQNLGISRATVSGLIKRLRANGYVVYNGCENDERHKSIVATQKALDLKKSLDNCMQYMIDNMFKGLSEDEIESFIRISSKLVDNTELLSKEEKR